MGAAAPAKKDDTTKKITSQMISVITTGNHNNLVRSVPNLDVDR